MNLFLVPILIGYVCGHQNPNFNNIVNPEAEPHIHSSGDKSGATDLWAQYGNHDFMHDLNHLREEANKLLYLQKSEQISNEDSAFYYTKLHDFNADGKLDGLELLLAVKHSLIHHNSTYENIDLENLAVYVDSELNLMDLNNDGFVDYGEIYTYMDSNKQKQPVTNDNINNNNPAQ